MRGDIDKYLALLCKNIQLQEEDIHVSHGDCRMNRLAVLVLSVHGELAVG